MGWGYRGVMHGIGHGVDKSLTRAAELFKKACDGGYAPVCGSLGSMYKKGAAGGVGVAKKNGVELIVLSDAEKASAKAAIQGALAKFRSTKMRGGKTGGEIYDLMTGK